MLVQCAYLLAPGQGRLVCTSFRLLRVTCMFAMLQLLWIMTVGLMITYDLIDTDAFVDLPRQGAFFSCPLIGAS